MEDASDCNFFQNCFCDFRHGKFGGLSERGFSLHFENDRNNQNNGSRKSTLMINESCSCKPHIFEVVIT